MKKIIRRQPIRRIQRRRIIVQPDNRGIGQIGVDMLI